MFSEERKEKIIELVNRKKTVKVSELSKYLDTSEVTIRRDLDELHSEKKLFRTHGGAVILKHENHDLSWENQAVRCIKEKKMIAKKALQYVCDHDVIIMDDSTTVQEFAKLIVNEKFEDLTVVTISIPVVNILLRNKKIKVVMIGGPVTGKMNAVLGTMAVRMLNEMQADKCFIGINGIQDQGVYYTSNYLEMSTKQAILKNSRQKFVLADHTKFGTTSFLKVEDVAKNIDCLITDKKMEDFDYSIIEKVTNLEIAND